jgi:phosphatidate cytidylyltransferase
MGVVLGIGAIFGDLAESLLKREAGVKDSVSIFPGH